MLEFSKNLTTTDTIQAAQRHFDVC